MGTCSTKTHSDLPKVSVKIPIKEPFNNYYTAIDKFYKRSDAMTIFKAIEKISKVLVVVKQIRKVIDSSSIQYEIEMLQKLDYPHIVRLYDYFQSQNHYFIIYQISRSDKFLEHFKGEKEKLAMSEYQQAFKQALRTLAYINSKSIFHGKLDASNTFFGIDGFLATGFEYAEDLNLLGVKKRGLIKYQSALSIGFQAPEVIKGRFGCPSDVWSLGVLFYSAVAGEMPFKGSSIEETKQMINDNSMDSIILKKRGFDDNLVDLLDKMLTKNYKERVTADQLLKHPFFEPEKTNPIDIINVYQDCKIFGKKNKLSQKFMYNIADFLMTWKDRSVVRESFQKFDLNNDGVISLEEFTQAIHHAGLSFKESEAKRLFQQIDHDGNGAIEYTEFLAVFAKIRRDEFMNTLKGLFLEMDKNEDEKISLTEFIEFLGQQPEFENEIEAFKALAKNNQTISYSEFCDLINKRLEIDS